MAPWTSYQSLQLHRLIEKINRSKISWNIRCPWSWDVLIQRKLKSIHKKALTWQNDPCPALVNRVGRCVDCILQPHSFGWVVSRTNKSHNGGNSYQISRRCVAHLYYTLNTELDSVDLVVKPSTTAEDTGRLTGTAAIPGSNTKSRFLRRQLFHIFLNSKEVLAILEDFKSYRI